MLKMGEYHQAQLVSQIDKGSCCLFFFFGNEYGIAGFGGWLVSAYTKPYIEWKSAGNMKSR